ncbi:hypothetical protein HELRODRAFT_162932 [Helobdella robusta]|uniref:Uncharacterized protein n=1 Tax=Helobdella robusta TaxID=6412 RepID=T1ETD6_HELRO|nr:hypothetical protein HELRODRAFT_162932 [Helobdella robusta]ESN99385.1 hypothetical protein HELRODRAFT_162932 [Helobdella robusta]
MSACRYFKNYCHTVSPHAINKALETLCLKYIIDSEPYFTCDIYHSPNHPSYEVSTLMGLHHIFWGPTHQDSNLNKIYGINVNLDITHTYRSHVSTHNLGVVAVPPPPLNIEKQHHEKNPSFISPFIKYLLRQKNKSMRSGFNLKAAITKYIDTLISFSSKTFTNSKRGSKAMCDQVNKIRGSDKSFNTSTS